MKDIFNNLDSALKQLGTADSSVEYAAHLREPFNDILFYLTQLKIETNYLDLTKEDNWYFD